MYRVIAIVGGTLLLAACSSSGSLVNLDGLKPEPMTETIQFETDPAGAEARTSTGQTCRTPCSLSLPANNSFTVTFNLAGYAPETETIELVSMGDGTSRLRPNPVMADLTPAPATAKKPAPAKKKPATKKKPTAAAPAPTNTAAAPAAPPPTNTAASPWPAPQPR